MGQHKKLPTKNDNKFLIYINQYYKFIGNIEINFSFTFSGSLTVASKKSICCEIARLQFAESGNRWRQSRASLYIGPMQIFLIKM